jgi:molecular chaperone DnaK
MVTDAEKFAAEDHQRREAAETRNEADQLSYQVDKSLEEWGDKVPESDRDELRKANGELKEALTGDDADRIKTASDAVMQKFQSIGQSMYQNVQAQASQEGQAAAGAAGGTTSGETSSPGDDGDDVVEGEIVDEGGAS